MIARVWTAEVTDAAAYEAFARDISIPMFRRQSGYRGVLMTRDGPACSVITIWSDQAAIEALATSLDYLATVSRIEALGIVSDPRPIRLLDVHEFAWAA